MEPEKPFIQQYNSWVKKNLFTMLGIILIFGLVLFELVTVEKQKVDIANKCNEYWIKQINQSYPLVFQNPLNPEPIFKSTVLFDPNILS